MYYLLIISIALSIAAPRIERWWHRFLTGNMRRQYNNLCYDILTEEMDYDEARIEIECFDWCWSSHPECAEYVALLKGALAKRQPEVDFKKELGI